MINALIVDDERLARQELVSMLEDFNKIKVAGEAANADEAAILITEKDPDLVFLDIQMPGKTGFELLEMLDNVPDVIFTTAYDEYALKAFEVNAFDYLLKPIDPKRLAESVNKYLENHVPRPKNQARTMLGKDDQVFVKDGDKCWFVRLDNIRLFESDGNYVKVFFDNFRPMIHKSLNALDEKLDDKIFFRASRKHIINLAWVDAIETWFNGGLLVKLKGGEKIEVSRRQASRFKVIMSL